MILTTLQKLLNNEEDWGKLIVAKGFKKLPKVQNIAQSGHTVANVMCIAHPACKCNILKAILTTLTRYARTIKRF